MAGDSGKGRPVFQAQAKARSDWKALQLCAGRAGPGQLSMGA